MKKILFFLTFLTSLNVYASCGGQFDSATGTCRFIDSSGREVLYNSAPPQTGQGRTRNVEHITIDLPPKYGAIAQSIKTGAFTSSLNKNSEREAKRTAVEYCESMKGNGKCRVTYTIANGCHALATGRISSKLHRAFYATGKNSQRGQSEAAALRKCQKSGAQGCKILMPEECSLPQIPR